MQQQDNHEYPFLYQRQTCHQVQPNQATYQKRQKCQPATYLQEVLYQLRSEERFSRNAETELDFLSLHDALPISLSAADLPPSPTKSSNLSETAEVPACNVPSRSPLPALAIAPETKLGTASSGLGTLEP